MEIKIKVKAVVARNKEQGCLNIVTKLDFRDILKQVGKYIDYNNYSEVDLSSLNVLPRGTEVKRRAKYLKNLEKNTVNELIKESLLDDDNNSAAVSLFTLRSNLLRLNVKKNSQSSFNTEGDDYTGRAYKRLINNNTFSFGKCNYNKKTNSSLHSNNDNINKSFSSLVLSSFSVDEIEQWKPMDFLKYIRLKYKETYGIDNLEIVESMKMVENGYGHNEYDEPINIAKGKIGGIIKNNLIKVFERNGLDNEDLKNYIDYMYDTVSNELDFPITVTVLKSLNLITNWMTKKKWKKSSNSFREKIKRRMEVV